MADIAGITAGGMCKKVIVTVGEVHGKDIDNWMNLTSKGGTCVLTAMGSMLDTEVTLNFAMLTLLQKNLQGTIFGGGNPHYDIPQLLSMYKAGKLNLQWQPGIFMDANLKNTGSLTATNAWGCAIDAGKTTEFHQGVFQQQAPEETVGAPGFTQQQMLDLGKTVGITGDAYSTFESCVKANTYNTWAANSNAQFEKAGVTSTPSIFVNGKELPTKGLNINDPTALIKAIEQAAKQ